MKPKFKKINKFLDFFLSKSVRAITLAPFGIYIREDYIDDKRIRNHESIHWQQQLEMLLIFFYIWYVIEFIIKTITTIDAYRSLSHEREAYNNDDNLEYLKTRKLYAWLKYINKKQ